MMRMPQQLREDLHAIWQAGVAAVRADRLVKDSVVVEGDLLDIDGETFDLAAVQRIVVVGAGKAGAGMAAGLQAVLGEDLMRRKQVTGWVNVPEDCVVDLGRIHLHGARPAGHNEPTEAGVMGTNKILQLVQSLTLDDLCIALIS